MSKQNKVILIGVAVLVLFAGIFAYDAVLGDTEEASEPISAVPLEVETENNSGLEVVPEGQGESTQNQPAAVAGMTVYAISQSDSEVSFTLSEVLRGSPTTVVGLSDQVAGEIAVDLSDLSTAQVGTIQVNARTFVTDEDRRNQTIRNRILFTDQYEFITFEPTEIVGLSGSAETGQDFSFQIIGDLTIRDSTQTVTFEVTAQVNDQGNLVGTAETIINRADFDLNIPSVPFVADVSEEVTLAIDFTASPTQ